MRLHQAPPDFQLCDANGNTVALHDFLKRERLIIALNPPSKTVLAWHERTDLVAQLEDFDLHIFCLFDQLPTFSSNLARVHFLHDTNTQTANRYETDARDVWLLVGNDGTTKHIWRGDFSIDDGFALINTMPMRQRELKKRGKN